MADRVITIHEEEVDLLAWAAIALREPTTAQEMASARATLEGVLVKLKRRLAATPDYTRR